MPGYPESRGGAAAAAAAARGSPAGPAAARGGRERAEALGGRGIPAEEPPCCSCPDNPDGSPPGGSGRVRLMAERSQHCSSPEYQDSERASAAAGASRRFAPFPQEIGDLEEGGGLPQDRLLDWRTVSEVCGCEAAC